MSKQVKFKYIGGPLNNKSFHFPASWLSGMSQLYGVFAHSGGEKYYYHPSNECNYIVTLNTPTNIILNYVGDK